MISPEWFDEIYTKYTGLVRGESNYYIAVKDGKRAIFDKDGNMITKEWFYDILAYGLIEGQSNYYIARDDYAYAVYHKSGRRVSDYFSLGLVWFETICEVTFDENLGIVTFSYDNGRDDILELNRIEEQETVDTTKTRYEIRTREDGKKAIFDENGKMITKEWYDWVSSAGLVRDESNYYIASENGKYAIFDVDGNQISQWFDFIKPFGLVEGKSKYYLVREDGKMAIFDKNGKRITEWFDDISPFGLVKEESDYYIACNEGNCAIYHKDGKKVSEDFSLENIEDIIKATFNEDLGIVEMRILYDEPKTVEFNPVYPFKENLIDYTKLLNI
jgi:antitoxin component YwqK of YwqJK toxin-antitoxin module